MAAPNDAGGGRPTFPFRLHAIMHRGTAAVLPGVWERYETIDAARTGAREVYHDERVLHVFIVTNDLPPRFVEWVER
jgi:hypothetical protein